MTPSDAEVVILPTQTEAVSQPTPSNGAVPTPPGSEDLQVAFASARSGLPQIYVTTLHGDITQLTDMKEGACQPAWSPDGSQIAFRSIQKGQSDIYTVKIDGSSLVNLTNNVAEDWSPAWSPDGKLIAFQANRDGNWEIYVMNADGTGQLNLTNNPADDQMPYWKK